VQHTRGKTQVVWCFR